MRSTLITAAIAVTMAVTPSSPPENAALAQLAQELTDHSDPGMWDDMEGSLVRERVLMLSEEATVAETRWATQFLKKLQAVDRWKLTGEDRVTWELLEWEASMIADRGEFFWLDSPVTPYTSPLRTITSRFAAARLQTAEDRQRYLDGLHRLVPFAAQIQAKLTGQLGRGIVLPVAQIDNVVPFIRTFAAGPGSNPFVVAETRLTSVAADLRTAFATEVHTTIADHVAPAFQRLAAFVEGPYRARAPNGVGLSQYRGGDRYYRFLVRQHTSLDLTPQQIHDIGLAEVARLERELDAARQQAGFAGPLSDFRTFLKSDSRFIPQTAEQIGERLMAAAARIEPKIPAFFTARPTAGYGARRLAPALEPLMTYGYYQAPNTVDPKGYYLYNGLGLADRSLLNVAALSYHELVPGHHFQIALTKENTSLSGFRQRAGYTAYLEGWGEYASDLAGEMGMYTDPYDRAGRLSMDLFLSTRLVVDTGMNAHGWSRERAMDYMREHTFESETQIKTESLRYSTDLPGQALAYKLGSRGIRELRERLRQELGARFDIKRFHQAVLGHGAMPLKVLEDHVRREMVDQSR